MTKRILQDGADFIVVDGQIKTSDGSVSAPSFAFNTDSDTGLYLSAANEIGITAGNQLVAQFSSAGLVISSGSELRNQDGSVGSPSYTFDSDQNTGLYLNSADSVGVSAGGVSSLTVDTSGLLISNNKSVFLAASGTAASPDLRFTGDDDTGIYRPAADQIGFTTNGVQRASFNANGLEIAQAGSAGSPHIWFNGDNDSGLFQPGANALGFSTAGVERLRIDGGGSLRVNDGTQNDPVITFFSDQDTGFFRPTSDTFAITTGGTERLRIDSTEVQLSVALDANNNAINNLPAPTLSHQPARLIDVQTASAGQLPKAPVDLVSNSNITLSGEQTIDGVLTSTSRVLVAGQTNADENGIYDTAAGAWSRATDHDGTPANEIARGNIVLVLSGTDNANRQYIMNGTDAADPNAIVPGSESQDWIIYSQAEAITNGTGLTKTGLTLALDTAYTDGRYLRGDTADTAAGQITFNAGALFSLGSAAAPSIAFAADTDSGIYGDGSNLVGITTAGSSKLQISNSGLVLENNNGLFSVDGSAATPSISFASDTDTGIYKRSTNDIAIATNGVERFSIDSIATVIRSGSLRIQDGTAASPALSFLSDSNTGMYSIGADILGFGTNGAERFRTSDSNTKFLNQVLIGGGATDISNTGVDSLVVAEGMYIRGNPSNSTAFFGVADHTTDQYTTRWEADTTTNEWNLIKVSGADPVVNINGFRVLTTADEGSGNGLDADTVDGVHASQFIRNDSASQIIDGGTNTTLTIVSDDTGESILNLYGDVQGSGRLFVGQSSATGGGLEYNGDGSPVGSGSGADYTTLFRRNAGSSIWTARNSVTNNNWEFRSNVHVNDDVTFGPTSNDSGRLRYTSNGYGATNSGSEYLALVMEQGNTLEAMVISDPASPTSSNDLFVLSMNNTDAGTPSTGAEAGWVRQFVVAGNGQIRATDGTAAAPTHTFDSDPNTGMFLTSADTLSFATGGTERFRVTNAGVRNLDGLVGSPSISFINDTDTGFYLSGVGSLDVAADAVRVFNVTSGGIRMRAGDLLIQDGTATDPTLGFVDDPDTGIYSPAANTIGFTTNGAQRAFINNDGMTIQDSNQYKMRLYNDVNAGGVGIEFSDNSAFTQKGFFNFYHSDTISPGSAYGATFRFETTEPDLAVIIQGAGDYFVGTNKVHREGNNILSPAGSAATPSYSFLADTDTGMFQSATNELAFSTAGTERMFLNSNGDLVLGTSVTSGARLTIGDASATAYTTTNESRFAGAKISVQNTDNTLNTIAGMTLTTGSTQGGQIELSAIRTSVAYQSDFIIKTRTGASTWKELASFNQGNAIFREKIIVEGSGGTIGGSNFDNGWIKTGTSSNGLTMDDNELYSFGSDFIIGTDDAAYRILFRPAAVDVMNISNTEVNMSVPLDMNGNNILNTSFQFGDGTSAAPSITFSADTDTGFYRATTNTVGITAGGTATVHVDGQGVTALNTTGSSYGSADNLSAFDVQTPNNGSATWLLTHHNDDSTWRSGIQSLNGGNNLRIYTGGGSFLEWSTRLRTSQDGTAASPVYSFINDTDTGMYRFGSNTIGFSAAGVLRATLDNSSLTMQNGNVIRTEAGTVTAPGYSFAGDTNTGFYLGAADSITASAGGVSTFTANTSGLFVSNNKSLFLPGTGSAASPDLRFNGDDDTGIYSSLVDTLEFTTGGVRRVKLDSTGLELNSGVFKTSSSGSASAPSYTFSSDTNTGIYTSAQGNINFSSDGNQSANINASGVRIGNITGDDYARVQYKNDTDSYGVTGSAAGMVVTTNENGSQVQAIVLSDQSDSATGNVFAISINNSVLGETTGDEAGWNRRFTLAGNGQIKAVDGSGSIPSYSFDSDTNTGMYLNAADRIGFSVAGSTVLRLVASTGLAVDQGGIRVQLGSASEPTYSFSSDINTGMYSVASDVIGFSAGGTERFRVDTSGARVVSGVLRTTDGTAAAPGITFNSDLNTGIYRATTDTLGISTAGVLRSSISTTRITNTLETVISKTGGNHLLLTDTVANTAKIRFEGTAGDTQAVALTFEASDGNLLEPGHGVIISSDGAAPTQDTHLEVEGRTYSLAFRSTGDGTVTEPAYSFNSDTNIGMYRSSENTISFSTGGSEAVRIDSNNALRTGDGTAAAPTHSFIDDNNTGMFSPANEVIGFTCSGTERARINTNGLEISSGQALYIQNGSAASPSLRFATDTDTGIFLEGTNELGFTCGGARYLSVGTFGIQVGTGGGSAAAPAITWTGDTNSGIYFGSDQFNIATGGTAALTINNTNITSERTLYIQDGSSSAPSIAFESDTNTGIAKNFDDQLRIINGGATTCNFTTGGLVMVTGKQFLGNGSSDETAPQYSFSGDTDTGMYSEFDNTIEFATAGVRRFRLGTANISYSVMQGPTGSASFPSFSFNGDNDTGMYRPTTNQVALATAGTQAMLIDASQEVFFPNISTGSSTDLHINTGTGQILANTSSIKYKKNVVDLASNASEFIYDLRCVHYAEKRTDLEFDGLIAEEVFELAPSYVPLKDGEPDSVSYSRLVVPVIAEMQKTKKENEDLKAKVDSLESELAAIKAHLGL